MRINKDNYYTGSREFRRSSLFFKETATINIWQGRGALSHIYRKLYNRLKQLDLYCRTVKMRNEKTPFINTYNGVL